ncbi:MAG: ABC transporter substrate-binding protein [Desertifilum sp.]|nr:ABC transporter substrate-binding protein [Desertifilum sp.]
MSKSLFKLVAIALCVFGLITCTQNFSINSVVVNSASAQTSEFQIWWSQGFLPEENEMISQLVSQWEQATGLKAHLTLLPSNILIEETQKALDIGRPPDIVFSPDGDTNLFPKLAWNNQLADVTPILAPLKSQFAPISLEAVSYQNKTTQKRSYYAVPLGESTVYIHYWKDALERANLTANELPSDWNAFWNYWERSQQNLLALGEPKMYGIGLCMSALGTDTSWGFEQFLEAYNARLLDENGQLLLDRPEVRSGIIAALEQYARFYQQGYVPPEATEWRDSSNNISFLDSDIVMTANSTLSIPLTQQHPPNPYNQKSNDLYFNKIATTHWPLKPDGRPLPSILSVKQAVVFAASPHQEAAFSFLSYLLQPKNLNQLLVVGNKGRFLPVMPSLLKNEFWNNPNDPHLTAATEIINQPTRASYPVYHPAYSQVISQNLWAKALLEIVNQKATPEAAADRTIAEIKTLFANWQ